MFRLALNVDVKTTALRGKASRILTALTRRATVTGSHTSCTNTDNIPCAGRTVVEFSIYTKSFVWQQASACSS